ncbi:MAG: prepilin peptidase [Lachnospiraceae bacterium]|nr:prepilin peptidase [Lachnospiraceae bacterium]
MTDLKEGKIYNRWTIPAACILLLLRPPPRALLPALLIAAILCLLRALAPGDIKYLLAVSTAFSFKPFCVFLVLSFVFSGIEILFLYTFCKLTRKKIPRRLRMAVPMGLSIFCHIGGIY